MSLTGWTETTVGQASEFLTGFPFPSSAFTETGIRLVRGSNVKRGVIDWSSDIARYWPDHDSSLRAFVLREGDIVIAMDGALVGRSFARITEAELPAYLVQRVARLRGKAIDQDLLYQWIGSRDFVKHVDDVKTHTAIPHISPRDIRDFKFSMPKDPNEQRAVSVALRDADDLIATLERLIAKKQAIKQGMMQQLLTGRTRLPGFSSSWDEVTWSEVVARQPGNGQIKGRLSSLRSVNALYPGYSASGQDVWLPTWDVEGEGVVISAVGSRCGRSFLATGRWSAIANTHIVLPRPDRLDTSFAMLYFDNESFWIKGGSGQPFVQVKSSLSRRVKLPPLEEQRAIMRVMGDVDRNISLLAIRLAKARDIKRGMMQQLLTGRVRLPAEGDS